MDATTAMVEEFDPHLMLVNLGDIDRFGHADLSGNDVRLLRRTALASTDRLVGDFVAMLKDRRLWDNAMMIVLADHSMDWSRPGSVVSLQDVMDADPLLSGNVRIAQNGGADLLYWTGRDADRVRAIERMCTRARQVAGVERAVPSATDSLRLGSRAGDVVAFCRAGWRFSDPEPLSNPIPGNHGHFATSAIPFFIIGGHARVPRGVSSPLRAATVDVAPTLMSFFGLAGRPRGGWDGKARL
jgi:arylsulfatase A-like enzyme